MLKYEVMKYEMVRRNDTAWTDHEPYVLYVDRVRVSLQPHRHPGDRQVLLYPRAYEHGLTLTSLASRLPEQVYKRGRLARLITGSRPADIRDDIAERVLTRYQWHPELKREILLSFKDPSSTEALVEIGLDWLSSKAKEYPDSMKLHLMSLEELLQLFPGEGDEEARAKLLALLV